MDMNIIDGQEVGRKSFGRNYFDHTKFICQRKGTEDDYYYGIGKCRFADATPEQISTMRLVKIPNEMIFPKYEEGLTVAPDPLPHNVYIKSPRIIDFGESEASANVSLHLLHEARMCELLKSNPHPNIAVYHGCIVKGGLIRGLCFQRYPLNLQKRAAENIPINIDHCFKHIKKGVKHMHTLGIAHNNIRPTNIMMDGDMPIIIDFASTLSFGKGLAGWRAGSQPWIPPEAIASDEYNDHYAAQQIYHWLRA
jgi:serine/threonine protein kinase